MTKKHDAVFDDVLNGLGVSEEAKPERDRNRFLRRGSALGEKLSGGYEEKTLHWVDPALCRMWEHHNRNYALLTPENTADLIDGLRAQGRQEFPAIVRRIDDGEYQYEVIAGARRHYAISWLRTNNYPQFKYLVEVRDLTDEEAFRLSDIENRDRADISDYERACDYAKAIDHYYSGRQKTMAERLMVSEAWLSRYLYLAKLPPEIVAAFPSSNDISERSARALKPLLAQSDIREKVLVEARGLRGQGLDAAAVMSRLREAGKLPSKPSAKPKKERFYIRESGNHMDFTIGKNTYIVEIPRRTTAHDFDLMAEEIKRRIKK